MEQQRQSSTEASVGNSLKVGVQAKNELLKDKIMKTFPGKSEIFKKMRTAVLSILA